MSNSFSTLSVIAGAMLAPSSLSAQVLPTVPSGLRAEIIATGLPSNPVDLEVAPAGFGSLRGQVFIAFLRDPADHTDGEIVVVDPSPARTVAVFADSTVAPDPWGLEFGSGSFGTDLYVNTWVVDPASQREGSIDRIDASGAVTVFGQPNPTGSSWGGVDVEFDRLGTAFGGKLYTGSASGPFGDKISCVDSNGGRATEFASIHTGSFAGSPGGMAFGTGLDGFSTDLYVTVERTGSAGPESGIYTIDSTGALSLWISQAALGVPVGRLRDLEFGSVRNSPIGDGMFVGTPEGVLQIDGSGSVSMFAQFATPTCGEWLAFDDLGSLYFVDEAQGALIRVSGRRTANYFNYGTPCRSSNGRLPTLRALNGDLPRVGETFSQELIRWVGTPFIFIGFNPFTPVPLDAIGLPGCAILTGWTDRLDPVIVSPGVATLDLPIPNNPGFASFDFYFQAAIADPGANFLNVALSNAGVAEIGF